MSQFNDRCWKYLMRAKDSLKTLELVDQQFVLKLVFINFFVIFYKPGFEKLKFIIALFQE